LLREIRARFTGGVLATLVVLACAASGADRAPVPEIPRPPPPERPALLPPPAPASAPAPAFDAVVAPAPASQPVPFQSFPQLSRAARAFDELAHGVRRESVRVLWLGDSHTMADHLTGAVRNELFGRYPPGGPGYLRLGLSPTRHEHAKLVRIGIGYTEPNPPSRRLPQGDGIFGLGGIRVSVLDRSALKLTIAPGSLKGHAHYSLLFDLPPSARFSAKLGPAKRTVSSSSDAVKLAGTPVLRLELEGQPTDPLEVEVVAGAPRFYGAIVEGTEPGVVLDAIGIDGARVATALAWDGPSFEAEVALRKPDLVVIAFGTNEAFDNVRVEKYEPELERLLERFRRGAPNADCVILGPPDSLAKDGTPVRRVPEISVAYAQTARRSGCAFVSQLALMGGFGSFATWQAQRPPLAFADGLHLTRRGYQRLGELIVGALFDGGAASAPVSIRSR
jgi:lysophospholipase L1-like esterase